VNSISHEVSGHDCLQYSVETLEDSVLPTGCAASVLCIVKGDGVNPQSDEDRPSFLMLFQVYDKAKDIDRLCK